MRRTKTPAHKFAVGKKTKLAPNYFKKKRIKEEYFEPVVFQGILKTTVPKGMKKKILDSLGLKKESRIFLINLGDKRLVFNEKEYDALSLLARGNGKGAVVKNVGIRGNKITLLKKALNEVEKNPQAMKELKKHAEEIYKAKKARFETDVSFHSTTLGRLAK